MVVIRVIYNQDIIPSNILDFNTVFLAGPSPKNQDGSYRIGFIELLMQSKIEYIVFDPQGANFDPTKGRAYALWELEALKVSKVIVFGLNTDAKLRIGLTTRTEFGHMANTRKNVVVYRPPDSYRTTYLRDRCAELNIPIAETMKGAVHFVDEIAMYKPKVRKGCYDATEILTNGVDPIFVKCTILEAKRKNTKGAIYVYVPLYDGSYHKLLEEMKFKFFIGSPKYLIWYIWNNPDVPDKVPEPGTSITGAVAILLNPDETKCLLVKTRYWGFPGGAIERGELDIQGLKRELKEEIGIDIDSSNCKFVGGYNQASARKFGKWFTNDPYVTMNDHFSVYVITISEDINFTIDEYELKDAKWFSVQDIINETVEEMNKFDANLLRKYSTEGNYFECYQTKNDKCEFKM